MQEQRSWIPQENAPPLTSRSFSEPEQLLADCTHSSTSHTNCDAQSAAHSPHPLLREKKNTKNFLRARHAQYRSLRAAVQEDYIYVYSSHKRLGWFTFAFCTRYTPLAAAEKVELVIFFTIP